MNSYYRKQEEKFLMELNYKPQKSKFTYQVLKHDAQLKNRAKEEKE